MLLQKWCAKCVDNELFVCLHFLFGMMTPADLSRSPNGYAGRMRWYRSQLLWTQRELAQATGISYRTIQNWEEGRSRPRAGSWQLRRMAELFRVSPSRLLFGEESPYADDPGAHREGPAVR